VDSFTWERIPGTYWIRGLVDPRSGLDDVEERKFLILPGFELRHLGRYTDYAIPAPDGVHKSLKYCEMWTNFQAKPKIRALCKRTSVARGVSYVVRI
jgi:hypothetical protein